LEIQWLDRNVDIDLLCKEVEQFLSQRNLSVKVEKLSDGYELVAVSRKILNVQLMVKVDISGTPSNFVVELTINKQKGGFYTASRIAGALSWLIGGGVLVLTEQKALENLEKIEHEFRDFIERKVVDLEGSATKTD
jgi:hypothetical protein